MCGIAGYFGVRDLSDETLETCLALMGRRGPDHAAWRCWAGKTGRKTYLLHSRLSIIDLDPRSNQPFGGPGQWIVFNGEIYNYVEMRRDLEPSVAFHTQSDTEVLLHAIARDGDAAFARAEGMWALALYDERSGVLTLSRDRFGEKPLFLYRDDSGVYFGSEVKFIACLLGRRLTVNVNHLCRYLVNGYKALYKQPETFFEGLTELRPATVCRFEADGTERQTRYWTPRCDPDDAMSYEEAVAGVRDRLIRSVELRLRADVPLAFCMSGGVDSNALISIAKNVFHYDVHGFTIASADARYDEQEMVDLAVRSLGIRHTSVPAATAHFLENLRTLVRYHDAPISTITYYAHWQLMESIAAHGYRISISGTAADELFTGYYDHHLAYLYEVRGDAARAASARAAWQRHVQPIVRNPFLQDPDAFIADPSFRDHIFLNAEEFEGFLRRPWHEAFAEQPLAAGLLRNRMLNELFYESVPVILHEDDLNAMYFSVENRSPYLDRDLFEFAYTIPSRHLVVDGRAKAVLRDAMSGIMPEPVRVNRRKVGFNAPIAEFLDRRDAAVRAAVLDESPLFDLVRRDKVAALLDKPELPNSESKFLFNVVNAKLFLEEFAA